MVKLIPIVIYPFNLIKTENLIILPFIMELSLWSFTFYNGFWLATMYVGYLPRPSWGQIFDLKSLKQVRRIKLQIKLKNYRKSMKKDLIETIIYFFSLSQLMGGPKPATLYYLSHSPECTIMLKRWAVMKFLC